MENDKKELLAKMVDRAKLKAMQKQKEKQENETLVITPVERAKELLKQYRKNMQKKLVDEN